MATSLLFNPADDLVCMFDVDRLFFGTVVGRGSITLFLLCDGTILDADSPLKKKEKTSKCLFNIV